MEESNSKKIPFSKISVHVQKPYGNPVFRILFSIQMLSMLAVIVHATAMPFLVRIAHKSHFLPTTSVFMMEVLKILMCLSMILCNGAKKASRELRESIWENRVETLKVAVPAIVYAIQNNLYYIALENIDPTTYSVTIQLRILTTALLAVVLLAKRLSWQQWAAQVLALIGVVLVQRDKQISPNGGVLGGNFTIGICAVIGMCWTSAFAGVYFEKMLKNSKCDVWTQNIRLSLLTLFFAGITMLLTDFEPILQDGMFQGWTWMVWLVTALNSIGGLCISLVMKYADNVMKTYCQSIAIGLTSLVSIFLGERVMTGFLIYGVLLVTSSVLIYSYFPSTNQVETKIAEKCIEKQLLLENDEEDDI